MNPALWLRFAARDLRSGLQGFWIFLTCLALGTGTIAIIGSLTAAMERGLDEQGQPLLGGDLEFALVHRETTPEEFAFIASKGVVSRVVPVEDMPFLDDGTSVDLVLNPLGVPSRMNVGQILETHLGWACANLGRQVGELVDEYRHRSARRSELEAKLKDIYGEEVFTRDIAPMADDELVELCENLKKGIPIATPVFDGARMADIEGMLEMAGLDTSGQVWLHDGRSGERFERKVTVG
jgi:hypothetical protein